MNSSSHLSGPSWPPPGMIEPARVVGVRLRTPARSGCKLGSADGPQPPRRFLVGENKVNVLLFADHGRLHAPGGHGPRQSRSGVVPGSAGGGRGPPGGTSRLGRPDGAPNVQVYRVPRLWGKHLLGASLLARAGRRQARRLAPRGARVVVNGGNCLWGDVNWVHYVHAAWAPEADGSLPRGAKAWVAPRRAGRRARVPTVRPPGDRQLGADPVRGDRAAGGRPGARPHGLLRQRPGAVPATDGRRAGRGPRPARLVRRSARRRLRRRPGRPPEGVRHAPGRLAAAGARPALGRPARRHRRGAALDGWKTAAADLADSSHVPRLPRRRAGAPLGLRRAGQPDPLRGVRPERPRGALLRAPGPGHASAGVAERYPAELDDLLLPDPNDAADLAGRLRRWRDRLGPTRTDLVSFSERLRADTWDRMAERFLRLTDTNGTCMALLERRA